MSQAPDKRRHLKRPWWAVVGLAISLLAPASASAQFQVTSIRMLFSDSDATLDDTDRTKYFNRARCQCGDTVRIEVESIKDPTNSQDRLTIVAGRACLDSNGKIDETECNIIYPARDVSQIDSAIMIQPTVADMMPKGCNSEESHDVIVYVGNTSEWTEAGKLGYTADGVPPSQALKDRDPVAGEGLASVYYLAGTQGNETDIKYQILCEKLGTGGAGRVPWSDSGGFTAGFVPPCEGGSTGTADGGVGDVDGSTGDAAATEDGGIQDATVGDAAPDDATADVATPDVDSATDAGTNASRTDNGVLLQDERFICSSVNSGTGKATIQPLETGVTYQFWVVSFDEAQNVTDPVSLGTATPSPSEDLWERYKRSGGAATGSYCSVHMPATPTWPLLALALLFIVRACRSRRPRIHRGSRK